LVAIITTISFDHQEFLGNSLAEIAKAKAGIIKNNCPVIIANQQQQAKEVLWQIASAKQAKIIDATFYDLPNNLYKEDLNLIGLHQLENLKLAYLTILNQNKFSITLSEISAGVQNVKWPARLQKIEFGNIKNKLKNCQLYLDGAHNIGGAKIITDFLSMQNGKKIVVFNMLKNKDLLGFLTQIQNSLDVLLIIDVAFHKEQYLATEILIKAKQLNIPTEIIDNFSKISNFLSDTHNTILICGSLYLAGHFLALN
jgi:dihydrofolate synthase/folylpolyglutamate synthase